MWAKIDDAFPEHRKVAEAGRHLGAYGRGRVIAIWTVGICYCNRNYTDGFVDELTVRAWTLYDRKPMDVATVMALPMPNGDPGLLVKVDGGFRFHDYEHYQPSSTEVKEKRKRDRERKRIRRESNETGAGVHNDSARNPARSRARDPDPTRYSGKITAADAARCGQPVENPKVLKALIWREVHAAFRDRTEDFTYPTVVERVKCVAARAGLVYALDWFREQVEIAVSRVPGQRRSHAA